MRSMLLTNEQPTRERHFGITSDGWEIALHRIPQRHLENRFPPVLLVHGLGANRYNLDGPGRLSVAEWLWRRGFEPWVIELRGAGYSSRPTRSNDLEWNWTFDDYVLRDLPTALGVIQRVTGRDEVHWIGHSLGGMIGYAYLQTHETAAVRSLSTIGSPSFAHLGNWIFDVVVQLKRLVGLVERLPYEGTGRALVPALPLLKETLGRFLANPRNVDTRAMAELIKVLPSDLPTSLLTQLADWYESGGFADAEGNTRYCDDLGLITTPTLVIAGEVDHLTPTQEIFHVYENLGSADKEYLCLSRANGCRHDYGHVDPVLGRWAPYEVWPALDRWIRTH